ncbi:MAG TPA: hypothetical protein VFS20_11120 [Longimicrobium sp.]|nr:hypothetical protein [Longimicrobium sp.]
MKKRKLTLDELAVETFWATPASREHGTVLAHVTPGPSGATLCLSCNGTCLDSCAETCFCGTDGKFTCYLAASCNPDATCNGCSDYAVQC